MKELPRMLLYIAIVVLLIGGALRLLGYSDMRGVMSVGITPRAFWELSLSLTGFAIAFSLLKD